MFPLEDILETAKFGTRVESQSCSILEVLYKLPPQRGFWVNHGVTFATLFRTCQYK